VFSFTAAILPAFSSTACHECRRLQVASAMPGGQQVLSGTEYMSDDINMMNVFIYGGSATAAGTPANRRAPNRHFVFYLSFLHYLRV